MRTDVLLLYIFVLALLARLIGTVIGNIRRLHSDLSDRSDDGRKEKKLGEEALHQAPFWECNSCKTQFRISDGDIPKVCPSCGVQLLPVSADMDLDVAAYNCLHCDSYFLLGGDDSDTCLVCGSKDIKEIGLVIKHPELWCCTNCAEEFTAPSTPRLCPHCGETFERTDGEVDDESSMSTCSACGKETEVMEGETMEWCPYCGEKI